MARRRRRRSSNYGSVPLLVGGIILCSIVLWVLQTPIVLFLVLALAGGGVALRVTSRRKAAARLAAWQQEQYQLQAQRSWHIAPYMSMSPREFEEALAFLCTRDGCTGARVVGGAGDLGADVIATTPDGWALVIQAKRYSHTNLVTGPDLQKFGGTAFAVHRADVAAVVTTSGFTKQAIAYAGQMGILLLDQDALARWAARTGPAPWHQPGSVPSWPVAPAPASGPAPAGSPGAEPVEMPTAEPLF